MVNALVPISLFVFLEVVLLQLPLVVVDHFEQETREQPMSDLERKSLHFRSCNKDIQSFTLT